MPVDPLIANSTADTPYGSTLNIPYNGGVPIFLSPKMVSDTLGWGAGSWLRYALRWAAIETSKNTYYWGAFDDAVSKCNAAGVNICWPILAPPTWRQKIDPGSGTDIGGNGTTCNTTLTQALTAGQAPPGGVIHIAALATGQFVNDGEELAIDYHSSSGGLDTLYASGNYTAGATQITVVTEPGGSATWKPQSDHVVGAPVINFGAILPNATDMAVFAQLVASRYNGQSGHGLVAAIQIGNEDWDTSEPRDLQSQWLVPVVQAAAPAIRGVHPSCRIGICAVRKTPKQALTHITTWMNNLWTYQGGIGGSGVNWLDFHYYRDGSAVGPDPTTEDKDTPSVATELANIKSIAASYGHFPEVWCGEFGWALYNNRGDTYASDTTTFPPSTVATYTVDMLEALRKGGGSKCFVYTNAPSSVVTNATLPFSSTDSTPTAVQEAPEIRSIVQTIDGTYTHLAPYLAIQNYAQKYPTWTGGGGSGTDTQVLLGRFLLSALRSRRFAARFNLQTSSVTSRIRKLSTRYKLSSLQPVWVAGRFNLQLSTSTRTRRKLSARYKLASGRQSLWVTNRINLIIGTGTNPPPPPDANPAFFAPPTTAVRCGIGTYQPLFGSAALSVGGGFPTSPGTVFHPYAGLYGGTYGYLLDTTIKQPQETAFTPAQEIGLDTVGVSVVRGFPQITWTYTTMRPDYWYYLAWLYQKSARVPSGYQYLVLVQYPSWDGTNTPVQQLARMNPPTYTSRTVAAFNGVSLVFQYVGQAILDSGTLIQVLS